MQPSKLILPDHYKREEVVPEKKPSSAEAYKQVMGNVTPAMLHKMQQYAIKYKRRHPNASPQQVEKQVCKKFNIKLQYDPTGNS